MKIGFIGQGWIGKHYADDFEDRGYNVVRFALEEPYINNKDQIADCDIVFIAVPTPTTPAGFDDSILRSTLALIGEGKIAVIKSTILPGTTESLHRANPNIFVLHSPEFLVEKTARYDASNPSRNLIGIPEDSKVYREKAEAVLAVLPTALYSSVMKSREAEFVKYAGNCFLFSKVLFMNLLYDIADKSDIAWEPVRAALVHDSRIGESHTSPVHSSGRGAGGHCFIKDFEAFRRMYDNNVGDELGKQVLNSLVQKNIDLLVKSGKDLDLVRGVYGDRLNE